MKLFRVQVTGAVIVFVAIMIILAARYFLTIL